MKIDITGRQINVTPALREFTEEKLTKLERVLDGPVEAHVVLGISKHRHTAELQILARNTVLSGAVETGAHATGAQTAAPIPRHRVSFLTTCQGPPRSTGRPGILSRARCRW